MGERQITEEDIELQVESLRDLQNELDSVEARYLTTIIDAHDRFGMTFQELADTLGVAKSWAYKLYQRGKRRGL